MWPITWMQFCKLFGMRCRSKYACMGCKRSEVQILIYKQKADEAKRLVRFNFLTFNLQPFLTLRESTSVALAAAFFVHHGSFTALGAQVADAHRLEGRHG
jgi:hypothetical protein